MTSYWCVIYAIEGYPGVFKQGPFSSEKAISEAADICGYEGVKLICYEEATEPLQEQEAGPPQYDATVSSSEAHQES